MKKLFTLFACAMFAAGLSAQGYVDLTTETYDESKSDDQTYYFQGTDITLSMGGRAFKIVERQGWSLGINFKNKTKYTINLPAGVKVWRVEMSGYSQGDNWEYLYGWGAGDQDGYEFADPIGKDEQDNMVIYTKARYPIDPCEVNPENEKVPTPHEHVAGYTFATLDFLDEAYEGSFDFFFAGNNQLDVALRLYTDRDAAVQAAQGSGGSGTAVVFDADNPLYAALGLGEDGVTVAGGTEIGSIEGVISFKIGAEDSYKAQNRGPFFIGDTTLKGGLQGNSNPKDADGGTPASTLKAPVQGAYFVADVNTDGYLYVFQQASSNKAYTIFENDDAIGYVYSAVGDATTDLGAQYGFELKGGGEYNYLKDAGITAVEWPEQIYCRNIGKYDDHCDAQEDGTMKWTKNIAKGGPGLIKFPVFAGCKYYINANGSKMTAVGFYFDTTGDATVTAQNGDATITLLQNGKLPGGQTAIRMVNSDNKAGNVYFNINGQRVDKNAKGIIIVNGKKYLNK